MATNPNAKSRTSEENVHTEWDQLSKLPDFSQLVDQRHEELGQEQVAPESLKDVKKLCEQLEKMGVDKQIMSNPAFRRELNSIITMGGLTMANAVSGDMQDKTLTLESRDVQGDAREHDRGYFSFAVGESGNLTIQNAYSDYSNDRRYKASFFGQYQGDHLTDSEGRADCLELEGRAAITEFSISEGGDRLIMTELAASATQITPYAARHDARVGIYSSAASKLVRQFDRDGVEQYREDYRYKGRSYNNLNNMGVLGMTHDGSQIDKASMHILRLADKAPLDIVQSERYQRNEDGTIKVWAYDDKKGNITIEKCPMNTQYGTDELIPSNGEIAAAFEKNYSDQMF